MTQPTLAAAGALPTRSKRARDPFKVELAFDGPRMVIHKRKFSHGLSPTDLASANSRLIGHLDEVRRLVLEHGVDLRHLKLQLLVDTTEDGAILYNKLTGEAGGAAQQWLADLETQHRSTEQLLSLNIEAEANFNPLWEMVYSGEPLLDEPEDPLAVWKQFWGFRFPIGRTFILPFGNLAYSIVPGAGLLAGMHEGLGYARQEIAEVAQHLASIHVGWQSLDQLLQPFELKPLISLLTDEAFGYGLVHLACHCENPEQASAVEAALTLMDKTNELVIKLKTLEVHQRKGFRHQPFIFLNACDSATLGHLLQTSSFPIGLLNFKAGGVIATACTVPDVFAREFAVEFYRRLAQRAAGNETNFIAVALYETRLHFLTEYHNPLGLAYGLYADATIRLEL